MIVARTMSAGTMSVLRLEPVPNPTAMLTGTATIRIERASRDPCS